ncbi:MAG: type II secretion system F family protein, partial [Candidatus Gracilibacteria bacterium]|nr:type II secretion system F family protein [Candidatus Gracilibacteria bacterium]
MPLYQYSIRDPKGKIINQTVSAMSREAAQKMLEKNGSLIIALKEIKKTKHWWEWSSPLKQKDILLITKRVGDMTRHGFSIVSALKTIELQTQNTTLKRVTQDIKNQVELGNSFSDALATYPKYFSNVFISLVKVGEQSGTLPTVLKYVEKQERQIYTLKKKAIGAMIYPSIILSMMVLIGIGMIIFLIPFLKDIFSRFTNQLPLPTWVLMKSEEILRTYWYLFVGGGITVLGGTKLLMMQKAVIEFKDRVFIHLPVFGKLIKSYNSAQIIRTFSTLNKTGVPLIQSLKILETVPKNSNYRNALQQITAEVDRGNIFSSSIEKFPNLFSPLVIETVKLGEEAGNLGDSMYYLAEVFEEEVKGNLKALTTFIQPLLLILVGVMVAGFALSVIVPLQKIP